VRVFGAGSTNIAGPTPSSAFTSAVIAVLDASWPTYSYINEGNYEIKAGQMGSYAIFEL
jgi:hypothetical protein